MDQNDLNQDLERAADLLARQPVDQWEIMAASFQRLSLAVRGEEMDKFQQSASGGLAIRVMAHGRVGFSYVLGRAQAGALEEAAAEALAAAKANDLEYDGGLPGPAELPQVEGLFDPALAQEPMEAKVARAHGLAKAARESDPRVVHVHPAEVSESQSSLRLVNSQGLDLSRQGTSITAVANVVAAEDGQQEMAWEYMSKRFLADLDGAWVGRVAGRRAAEALGGGPVPDGRYPVVLENQAAASLLEILASSLSGESVVKGRSLLADLLGKQAISPVVTILDDGLMTRGLGSAPFDDEGTPMTSKALVKDGVVESFVFDRLWGSRAGKASTGNAVRGGLKAPPGVGFTNLYIQPGQGGVEELAQGMETGILITEMMGLHTADPVSGEFSVGASGRLIEDGKLGRAVRSVAIAGQVVDLFKAVEKVGGDLRFLGRIGSPSLMIPGLSVSG